MSIFSKIANSLQKTKNKIADTFARVFSIDRIGEEFYDELTDALVASDISYQTASEIVENLRDEMIEGSVKDKGEVVKALKTVIKDKLYEVDGIEFDYPLVIMVVGVNGVGKTTTIGKLSAYFTSQNKSVTIVAGDTFRAAASDQLSVWADRANVRVIKHGEGADPSAVVYDAISSAKAKNTDVLIIDTAGRLHVKSNLMEELKKMVRVVDREYSSANFYKFIVLDATTGQNAISQVDAFDDAVSLDGIILTKLDGTAKGGFVVSLCEEKGLPIVFAGVGEKLDDLVEFDVDDFVDGLF